MGNVVRVATVAPGLPKYSLVIDEAAPAAIETHVIGNSFDAGWSGYRVYDGGARTVMTGNALTDLTGTDSADATVYYEDDAAVYEDALVEFASTTH